MVMRSTVERDQSRNPGIQDVSTPRAICYADLGYTICEVCIAEEWDSSSEEQEAQNALSTLRRGQREGC